MKIVLEVAEKIRSLEIQGATNIAIKALVALAEQINELNPKSKNDTLEQLNEIKKILFDTRPTEPAMRNGVRYVIFKVTKSNEVDASSFSMLVKKSVDEYVQLLKEAKKKIGEIGSNRITDGMQVLTHCHSSVVTNILITAFNKNKKFEVICTETRPLFQGRLTARELINAGITTTMVVDSAMRWAIQQKEVDLILVGADAITSEGVVINKIGTRLLALAAYEYNIPFYVATPVFKFDPETIIGKLEKIEMRDPSEIWADSPKNLKIENPAFETVSRHYIDGLITEIGIIPPSHLYGAANQTYPFIFES
ncbi:MAG: translation initiation factor eIF-2B, partial [Candidatus Odinarchaeia archaeon]